MKKRQIMNILANVMSEYGFDQYFIPGWKAYCQNQEKYCTEFVCGTDIRLSNEKVIFVNQRFGIGKDFLVIYNPLCFDLVGTAEELKQIIDHLAALEEKQKQAISRLKHELCKETIFIEETNLNWE